MILMESDNRNGQFCEKQTCDFLFFFNPGANGCDVKSLNVCRIVTCPWFDSKARHLLIGDCCSGSNSVFDTDSMCSTHISPAKQL